MDLYERAQRLPKEGLQLPVLVRVVNILHDRVDQLTGAFADVIAELGYQGQYTAVYPIKVNQQGDVVEEIVRHGGERVGIEAGSKRSEEHTSELQSLMRNSYAVFCLNTKKVSD